MRPAMLVVSLLATGLALAACAAPETARTAMTDQALGQTRYAIALHGGAGTIPKDTPAEKVAGYTEALAAALRLGESKLRAGERAADVAQAVVMALEDDPRFNAGRGAVFTSAGTNELDAAIMDGRTLRAGAVAGVSTVKNPIALARAVMDRTAHVMLAGAGAEALASEVGLERVEPGYFRTEERWEQLQRTKQRLAASAAADPMLDEFRSTVGCVVLDTHGDLAAATSTGGTTNKRPGRIGDTPIIGAGTYAANDACAVSGTGLGEQFIRHGVARDIADRVRYRGFTLSAAADQVVHGVLDANDGGVVAVSGTGEIAMPFNTAGMFRAAADWTGRFEVAIWDLPQPLPAKP